MFLHGMFHYIFLALCFFQILLMAGQWILFRRHEYYYYIIYITFMLIFIAFRLDYFTDFLFFSLTPMVNELLDQPLIIFAYWMYVRFGYFFLQLKQLQPGVYKYAKRLEYAFAIFVLVKCVLIPLKISHSTSAHIYFVCTILLTIAAIPVIIQLLRQKNKLNNYLVLGSLSVTIGGALGPILAVIYDATASPQMWIYIPLEISILIELLLLNYGLIVKLKMLTDENSRIIINQHKLILIERERIIADLHDDVGATLSSMHIYGDLAKHVWETQPHESKKMIDKISTTSKDLMSRMGDIIWSMKPPDEEKFNFATKLKNYSTELLSPKNIFVEFEIDENVERSINSPEMRKNILLIAKEVINNIAKYSEAEKATISFKKQNETIVLSISDDGKGFDTTVIQKGNGLQNIQQRCKQLNGFIDIKAGPGQGVRIDCSFPIATFSHI